MTFHLTVLQIIAAALFILGILGALVARPLRKQTPRPRAELWITFGSAGAMLLGAGVAWFSL